jgi:DNA repair exonuclease SbcCD ATPase subunit
MENLKQETIAPIMQNHQSKSLASNKFDRVQSELDRANSRMAAANTLTQQIEQLSKKVLELLSGKFPSLAETTNDLDSAIEEIKYCISLISYCLMSGNSEPIAVNLISELKENPSAFGLDADGLIAVFNCLKENSMLADEAKDAANEYIEEAIAALNQLDQTEESSKLKTPEKSEILTLEEIQEKYPQQWVMIAYNERDEYLNVIRGEVLAYSPDCDEIEDYLPNRKGRAVAIEYTGPIPDDLAVML